MSAPVWCPLDIGYGQYLQTPWHNASEAPLCHVASCSQIPLALLNPRQSRVNHSLKATKEIIETDAEVVSTKLRNCVAAVDAKVSARDIVAGVREKIGDRAHQVFGLAHLAHRDERGPVFVQLWVLVEDLLGSKGNVSQEILPYVDRVP